MAFEHKTPAPHKPAPEEAKEIQEKLAQKAEMESDAAEESRRKRPYIITDESALYKAAPHLFKQVPNHTAIQAIWRSMPPCNLPGIVAAEDAPPLPLTPLEQAIHHTKNNA